MRTRSFLILGVVIGALVAVARLLVSRRATDVAEAPLVVGTKLFEGVFSHVQAFAVDSLDAQELYRRAASGMIEELDDPYAVLLLPGQQALSPDSASPQGLFLDSRDGAAVVVATVPGSAADSAGVEEGDLLLAVDSTTIDPAHLERGIRLLEGEPGTPVTLRLRRSGVRGVISLDLVRRPLPPSASASSAILGGQVGVLALRRIAPGTADSVRAAILALRRQGARSLVLDLRGVVGGPLEEAVAVADVFLGPPDTLAVSRGRPGAASVTYADSSASEFDSLPMAVLVDGGTAGAAEVIAGALQDHDRAAVIGATTFGRGVTQSTFPLGQGASLRLTTALWMTPSGRQIQRPPRTPADSVPRPRLKSDAGRVLQGGGGIVPDRAVSDTGSTDRVLESARRLLSRAATAKAVLGLIGSGEREQ